MQDVKRRGAVGLLVEGTAAKAQTTARRLKQGVAGSRVEPSLGAPPQQRGSIPYSLALPLPPAVPAAAAFALGLRFELGPSPLAPVPDAAAKASF